MLIFQIVLSFMKIGILSFGGAYASIPLVEKEIVELRQWMSYEEFADLLSLDELTPGPILINCATFVGMKTGGIPGAVAATFGCILPSCIISFILILAYKKYKKLSFIQSFLLTFKCVTIALIFSTFTRIAKSLYCQTEMTAGIVGFFLTVVSFYLLRRYKINPLYIMLGCGFVFVIVNGIV